MSDIEWRKIPYLPDRYEASSDGRIRTLDRTIRAVSVNGEIFSRFRPGKELKASLRKGQKSRGTHPTVTLTRSPGEESFRSGETRVCILVARAFHGCPYIPGDRAGRQNWRIMHRDGDTTNNAANNLEWVCSNTDQASRTQYEQNLLKLEELSREPVEAWIKRIWGIEYTEA